MPMKTREVIHISCEVIILSVVSYFFHKKLKKLSESVDELKKENEELRTGLHQVTKILSSMMMIPSGAFSVPQVPVSSVSRSPLFTPVEKNIQREQHIVFHPLSPIEEEDEDKCRLGISELQEEGKNIFEGSEEVRDADPSGRGSGGGCLWQPEGCKANHDFCKAKISRSPSGAGQDPVFSGPPEGCKVAFGNQRDDALHPEASRPWDSAQEERNTDTPTIIFSTITPPPKKESTAKLEIIENTPITTTQNSLSDSESSRNTISQTASSDMKVSSNSKIESPDIKVSSNSEKSIRSSVSVPNKDSNISVPSILSSTENEKLKVIDPKTLRSLRKKKNGNRN